MEENKRNTKLVMANDLVARFRSKEDIYRYLTQQGNRPLNLINDYAAGVFLPSIRGTSIDFMREILRE